MKLPAYPRIKPSGVEWLGDVPEHWEVKRLKTSATCWVSNVDKVPAEDELPVRLCNYTDVYYHDYITPEMELMETTATVDEIRRFGLRKGDVVITKDSEEWSDIAIPALVKQSAPDLVCGYHLAIIRSHPKVLRGDYLLRTFQSCAVNQQFQLAASGVTRYGLPKASIGDAWIPLPDTDEQHAIATFLDRETGRIDRLMAKNRELIERLKEKRTAIITHTITRGLPPAAARAAGLHENSPLKPSGLEWLDDVPSHWKVLPLKRAAQVSYGVGGEIDRSLEDGLRIISLPNIDMEGNLTLDKVPYANVPASERRAVLLRKGDLLFNWRNGSSDHLGKTAYFDADGDYSHVSFLLRIRFEPGEHCSRFFQYLIGGYRVTGFFKHSKAGVNNTFNLSELSALPVIIPPRSEQIAIAAYLDAETAKLDALVEKVKTAVERLQECRTALITAAVTGKIDVRKEVAP